MRLRITILFIMVIVVCSSNLWGWGNGHANTTYSENDYIKGTLVIDVYDNSTNQLIWQGVASGTVKENPKKREKSIPKTVGKLMKKFPIQLTE